MIQTFSSKWKTLSSVQRLCHTITTLYKTTNTLKYKYVYMLINWDLNL